MNRHDPTENFADSLYYRIRLFRLFKHQQGGQVPGNFRASPEKYVQLVSPELFSKARNV